MATAAVFGSTGAVGSQILSTLLTLNNSPFSSIKTISRRLPKDQAPNLEAIIEPETSKWSTALGQLDPKPFIVFNAVGTTRATAGSIQAQWKIDHDLVIETAQAAKEAGVKTFVFISSAGTRGMLSSFVPYSKMKIGVEDKIKELGFEQAIIVRPGMILGEREKPKAPVLEMVFSNLHRVSWGLQDSMGQDQKVIGRAAVAAARIALEGKAPSKYWTLEQADVVKYGRDEWKE